MLGDAFYEDGPIALAAHDPARGLLSAIVLQAIVDLGTNNYNVSAERWFNGHSGNFEYVCMLLGLQVERVRDRVLGGTHVARRRRVVVQTDEPMPTEATTPQRTGTGWSREVCW